jgi:hypothetical protein
VRRAIRTSFRTIAVAVAVLFFAGLRDAEGSDVPDCVAVWGEARHRNHAYDHIVHLANHCPEPVQCEVWTSVSPARIPVRVEAYGHEEVLTFRASPARDFIPRAACGMVL